MVPGPRIEERGFACKLLFESWTLGTRTLFGLATLPKVVLRGAIQVQRSGTPIKKGPSL